MLGSGVLKRVQAQVGSRCQAQDGAWWERMSDGGGRGESGDLPRGCVLDGRLKTVGLRQHWLDGMWSRRGCMLGHARDARLETVQGGKWEVGMDGRTHG